MLQRKSHCDHLGEALASPDVQPGLGEARRHRIWAAGSRAPHHRQRHLDGWGSLTDTVGDRRVMGCERYLQILESLSKFNKQAKLSRGY